MSRLHIATRGIGDWQSRLASPTKHWVRGKSAFETAVSWELADSAGTGLPPCIEDLFNDQYGSSELLIGVAEHCVKLAGGGRASQNDVWGLVRTPQGTVSLVVEAKAAESFGDATLAAWLQASDNENAQQNRNTRWEYIQEHLPPDNDYLEVRYQLLHRCASAVIEARNFGLTHAACIIQSFGAPQQSFDQYAQLCNAIGIACGRGVINSVPIGDLELAVGWAECPPATDREILTVTVP